MMPSWNSRTADQSRPAVETNAESDQTGVQDRDCSTCRQALSVSIIDMNYDSAGPITRLNVKGLVESDSSRRAIRPKLAYSVVQNVVALFDDTLEPIPFLKHTHNVASPAPTGGVRFNPGTDRSPAVSIQKLPVYDAPVLVADKSLIPLK
jgi:hypothetical protein